MVEESQGISCDVDTALVNLTHKERRAKRAMPWKVALEIGPDVKINVAGYIKVRREPPKSWKKCLATKRKQGGASRDAEDEDELKADVTFVKNNEGQDVIEGEQIIESYKYGSELITVSGNA